MHFSERHGAVIHDHLIDQLPVGVVVLSGGGVVLAHNRPAAEIFGSDPRVEFEPWLRSVGASEAVSDLLATGEGTTMLEGHHQTAGRPSLRLRVLLAPANDPGHETPTVVGVVRDVTDEHLRTVALQAHAAELRRSNVELESFSALAAHDLQEPLRKISAFGDRLAAGYADVLDERGQDLLRRLLLARERMSTLITDLLGYARVSVEEPVLEAIDLGNTVREVASQLGGPLRRVGGRIDVGDLPLVQGDRTKLHQLFENLLTNAIKYHSRDRELVVAVYGDDVHITVADNGIGFDSAYSERIFAPFERLHDRYDYPGSGIGLAICRRVAESHGWAIRADAEPGSGARFHIDLHPEATEAQES